MSKVFFRFLILMNLVLLEIGKVFIFDFMQVRRLRVQQRIKCRELVQKSGEEENEMPDMPSTIPFLPPMVIFPPPFFEYMLKMICMLMFFNFLSRTDHENVETALSHKLFSDLGDYSLGGPSCSHCKPISYILSVGYLYFFVQAYLWYNASFEALINMHDIHVHCYHLFIKLPSGYLLY